MRHPGVDRPASVSVSLSSLSCFLSLPRSLFLSLYFYLFLCFCFTVNIHITTYLHLQTPSPSFHRFLPQGERCSFSVQMWFYFLCGLRSDLWAVLPPDLAKEVLGQVLSETLQLLVRRYAWARPSYKRHLQIRYSIMHSSGLKKNIYLRNLVPLGHMNYPSNMTVL